MRTVLLGAVGLVALGIAPTHGADLPAGTYTKAPAMVSAIYDWSGFYLGLNAGGASSHNCWTNTNSLGVATIPNVAEGCHNATGGLAGGQLGYRWQSANWVFGVEASGDWANLKGSNPSAFIAGTTNQTKVDAVGQFTGQVGYAWNTVLWYLKGGAAVTDNKYQGIATTTGVVTDQATATRWGGVVGTGVELSFAPNWSVGVEYDHMFLGNHNATLNTTVPAPGGLSRIDSIRQDVDMGSVHVNYRWGGPTISKY
jgi:outer membrane immunogenic protein